MRELSLELSVSSPGDVLTLQPSADILHPHQGQSICPRDVEVTAITFLRKDVV